MICIVSSIKIYYENAYDIDNGQSESPDDCLVYMVFDIIKKDDRVLTGLVGSWFSYCLVKMILLRLYESKKSKVA